MNTSPEKSPAVRRIERRYLLLNWISGTVMTLSGLAVLILLFARPKQLISVGTHLGDRSPGAAYGIVAGFAALLYGVATLARLLKRKRGKLSGDK